MASTCGALVLKNIAKNRHFKIDADYNGLNAEWQLLIVDKKSPKKDKKDSGKKKKEERKKGPDRNLKPNPKIKILEKDPFFETR